MQGVDDSLQSSTPCYRVSAISAESPRGDGKRLAPNTIRGTVQKNAQAPEGATDELQVKRFRGLDILHRIPRVAADTFTRGYILLTPLGFYSENHFLEFYRTIEELRYESSALSSAILAFTFPVNKLTS